MKACVLHAVADLRYEEVETPKMKEGEALVKIKACGICGSDLPRVWTKGTYHFPTIPGHEFSGEIVDCADKSLIGKKVAVFPLLPCGKCASCQTGNYAQCADYNYFGSRCDGGFAEYISVPLWNLVFADDCLSYEEIAMAEPCAVALHAIERANVEVGNNVAIFGAGPIGIMLGKWAKFKGAGKVFLVDIDPTKIEFAKAQGFKYVYDKDAVEQIMKETNGLGADVAIEGAGVSSTFEQALACAKAFGTVVTMGNPAGEMKLTQNGYWHILRKELSVRGTWNSSYNAAKNDWQTGLNALATGKMDIKPLVSHRFSLEDCNKAFTMMRDKTEFFNKVMFVIE